MPDTAILLEEDSDIEDSSPRPSKVRKVQFADPNASNKPIKGESLSLECNPCLEGSSRPEESTRPESSSSPGGKPRAEDEPHAEDGPLPEGSSSAEGSPHPEGNRRPKRRCPSRKTNKSIKSQFIKGIDMENL
jgi:hypothetical protein